MILTDATLLCFRNCLREHKVQRFGEMGWTSGDNDDAYTNIALNDP